MSYAIVNTVGHFLVNDVPTRGAVLTFPDGEPDFPLSIIWQSVPMRLCRQDIYDDMLDQLRAVLTFLEGEILTRGDFPEDSMMAEARKRADSIAAVIKQDTGET